MAPTQKAQPLHKARPTSQQTNQLEKAVPFVQKNSTETEDARLVSENLKTSAAGYRHQAAIVRNQGN